MIHFKKTKDNKGDVGPLEDMFAAGHAINLNFNAVNLNFKVISIFDVIIVEKDNNRHCMFLVFIVQNTRQIRGSTMIHFKATVSECTHTFNIYTRTCEQQVLVFYWYLVIPVIAMFKK